MVAARFGALGMHILYSPICAVLTIPCAVDRYTGVVDCVYQTVAHRGVSGLYCGQTIMCVRETIAFGVYFGCYDFVKR